MPLNPPAYNAAYAITPSDTVNFDGSTYSAVARTKAIPCEAIYVGSGGSAIVVFENGTAVEFVAVSGEILPLKAIRVNSGSTTASLMYALYTI